MRRKPPSAFRRHYLGEEVFASIALGLLFATGLAMLMAIISSMGPDLFDLATRYSFVLLMWALTASWVAWFNIRDASSARWRQLSDSERERWLGVDD